MEQWKIVFFSNTRWRHLKILTSGHFKSYFLDNPPRNEFKKLTKYTLLTPLVRCIVVLSPISIYFWGNFAHVKGQLRLCEVDRKFLSSLCVQRNISQNSHFPPKVLPFLILPSISQTVNNGKLKPPAKLPDVQ